MTNAVTLERFRAFASAAADLVTSGRSPSLGLRTTEPADDVLSRFAAFAQQARQVLEAVPAPVATAPLSPAEQDLAARYRVFVERAVPLAIGEARRTVEELLPVAGKLTSWKAPLDVVSVAGGELSETVYTELLAWAFSPPGHPELALACQRSYLRHLVPELELDMPLRVDEQVWTDDGVPDIVLHGNGHLHVIEAKTVSSEHATPSGEMQTVAYARWVPAEVAPSTLQYRSLIFLTLGGQAACNEAAICSTWLEVALCLADALETVDVSPDLRGTYAAIVTHWVRHATPGDVDAFDTFESLAALHGASDRDVLDELPTLRRLAQLLPRRVKQP
jgi:hypothetical protein